MSHPSTKPEAILQLEQELGFELTDLTHASSDTSAISRQPKSYACNQEGEVIQLNLTRCELEEIPNLLAFEKLLILELSNNKISHIEGLEKLTNLQSLELSWNQITSIEGLEKLTNLQELVLGGNQLTCIEGLEKLTNLYYLDLSYNQLTHIEGLEKLTSLQSLNLWNNQLTRIEGLEKLTNLQSLSLFGNQITSIEGLDKLTNLQSLDLNWNQITSIEGLDKLTNLQSLGLSDNQLTRIEELAYLSRLESLDLSNNELSVIENLPQTSLKELTVGGNNIEYIRSSFSDKDSELLPCRLIFTPYENHLEDIKRWQLRKPLETLVLPIKVMLLGNHSSGKSTFLNSLHKGKGKKKTGSTHVLRVVKRAHLGANFYDFGGQDFYHGIYHAFYSSGALYMLFWRKELDKNRQGLELVKGEDAHKQKVLNFNRNYWLGQIRYADRQRRIVGQDSSRGENILVVQTYADHDHQQNLRGSTFRVREEFYIALEREGTEAQDNLLQKRDEAAKRYLHLRLEEEIALLKKKMSIDVTESEGILYNYILYKKKRKKSHCPIRIEDLRKAMPGYTDSSSSLKGELHQLYLHGEVLYYKDDKELSDLVWLDPEATVNYIHTEILDKGIIGRRGVVEKAVLEKKDKHLVRLLELEKVIYYNKNEDQYIIPGYLPLADGDEMYEWLKLSYLQPNITLKFEHFIPFGLINQLICYYGQGENELKKFWRDQLFFTLVNTPSEEERSKRGRNGFSLYEEDRGTETYPRGRYMVWVSLNHEQLTIEVYIKPIDQGVEHRVSQLERMLLQDILDMYWSNIPPSNDEGYLSRRRQEHRRLREKFPIEDLYISTSKLPLCQERRLFVNLASIDNYDPEKGGVGAGGSRGIAVGYPLNEDGTLNKEQAQAISLRSFQHLTDNKHIGKMKKVFISYSKEDKSELKICLQFFKPLEDEGLLTIYYDERTEVGDEIHPTIRKEIAEADVIVVLVSPSLLSTDYITRLELPLAKDLGKRIYPFILKPCMWEDNEIIEPMYVALKGETGASEEVYLDKGSGAYVSESIQLGVWKKFMEEFKEKVLHIKPVVLWNTKNLRDSI